jgi:hypothetical protein
MQSTLLLSTLRFALLLGASSGAEASLSCMPCPADISLDGLVDGADLGMILAAWNTTGGPADLDGSGLVDGADLGALLASWGACPDGASCPESDHGCLVAGGPGCTDIDCCAGICANDPLCCSLVWDAVCVNQALLQCAGASDCCAAHALPGCPNLACESLVCGTAPGCCELNWDVECALWAELLCEFCAPLGVVAVSPGFAQSGELLTIQGLGFPVNPANLCIMARSADGRIAGLRAVSASREQIVAKVGPVPAGFSVAQIQVTEGVGVQLTKKDLQLLPNVSLMPDGAWSWQPQGGAARSGSCVQLASMGTPGGGELPTYASDGAMIIDVPSSIVPPLDEGVAGGDTLTLEFEIYGHVHFEGSITVFIFDKSSGTIIEITYHIAGECDFCITVVVTITFGIGPLPSPAEQLAMALGDTLWQILSQNSPLTFAAPTISETPEGARIELVPLGEAAVTAVPIASIRAVPAVKE